MPIMTYYSSRCISCKVDRMAKKDTLKMLALFMSCLIISLPFIVADARAQAGLNEEVTVIDIKGKDGVSNVRAMDQDYVDINVNVRAAAAIQPSDVHILYSGMPTFSTFLKCDLVESPFTYNCNYRSPLGLMSYGPGIYPLRVCLSGSGRCSPDCSSCSPCPSCLKNPQLYVDGYPPQMASYDVNPKNTNGQSVTATYSVEDRICAASSCRNICSGIKKIEIIDLSSATPRVIHTKNYNTQVNDCKRSETITFSMASVNDGSNIPICIKAYDNVGLESPDGVTCIKVNKDDTVPRATLDIYDSNGVAPLRFIRPSGTQAKVVAKITGSVHFGISSAKADLSDLGYSDSETLTCTGTQGSYACSKIITVKASSSLSVNINAEIIDAGGNKAAPSASFTIELDSEAPVVQTVLTEYSWGNNGYLRKGLNNITAVITDEGVGMAGSNVFISAGGAAAKNAVCKKVSEEWHCSIYNVPAAADLNVTVGGWECSWVINNVMDGGMKAAFNISDIVGNRDTSTKANPITEFFIAYIDPVKGTIEYLPYATPIEVYELDTDEAPDYWEVQVLGANPPMIDSVTNAYLGHDVWFPTKLSPRVDDVSLVLVFFDPNLCSGEDAENYLNAQSSYIVSSRPDSKGPWIKTSLFPSAISQSNLNYQCQLTIISKRNNKILMPERENISLNVGVIQVDEIDSVIQREIDDVEGSAIVQAEWIGTLTMVIQNLMALCNIYNTIKLIIQTVVGIGDGLASLEWVPIAGPGLYATGTSLSSAFKGLDTSVSILGYLDTFCAIVTCQITLCKNVDGPINGRAWCAPFNAYFRLMNGVFGGLLASIQEMLTNLNADQPPPAPPPPPGAPCPGSPSVTASSVGGGVLQAIVPEYNTLITANPTEASRANLMFGNPSDSLIMSMLQLCIPGILLNLNKMREIECTYLYCLKNQIPAGVPPRACTIQRSYSWCMFVWGEIFSLIPFSNLLRNILQMIMRILTDPATFIGILVA